MYLFTTYLLHNYNFDIFLWKWKCTTKWWFMKTILKLKLLVILVSYYTLFFVFFESLYYTLGQPFLLRMYIGYINPDYFKIVKNVYRVFFFFIIVLKKKFFRLHDKRKSRICSRISQFWTFFCQIILEQWATNFVKFHLIISIFTYPHYLRILDSF